MKKIMLPIAATCLGLYALSIPATENTEPASSRTAEPSNTDSDAQKEKLQAQLKQMQVEMDKIRKAGDPQERQRLMDNHWRSMQDSMGMMINMHGSGMWNCDMMQDGVTDGEGWMNMMNIMMDQMRQHQEYMQPKP